MADEAIDLSTVPLAALTAELKRRLGEFEEARQQLGLIATGSRMPRASKASKKGGTSNPRMAAAASDRWAGWETFKKAHPDASTKDYWQSRRKKSK